MQPGNCLGFWFDLYESVALGGLGEDRRRKGLCVTDTDGLSLCMAFHSGDCSSPCTVHVVKRLVNTLGFTSRQSWQIKSQQIQVVEMFTLCMKVLEGPHHT